MDQTANRPADEQTTVRPRPALFRALGRHEPPEQVQIDGQTYSRMRVFKHDSWAATALYADDDGRLVVCKFNRRQGLGLISLRWLGHWLAWREGNLLRRLHPLPNVPRWTGNVYVNGQRQWNAVAHDFIPGHPLGRYEHVNDDFFPALRRCLADMHRRDVAYVDLHKRENILVGDDGRPYLLDFQIGVGLPHWWPANCTLTQILLRVFQRSDDYHLHKHLARCRPDQAGHGEEAIGAQRPWWITLHRLIAVPLRTLRRGLLARLGVRGKSGRVETEHFPEEVVRADRETQKAA